jgi:PAS domain S-box-containing protein
MDLQRPHRSSFRGAKSVLQRIILAWLALVLVAGTFISTIYRIELVGIRDMAWAGERQAVQLGALSINRQLAQAGADLLYLSRQDGLSTLFRQPFSSPSKQPGEDYPVPGESIPSYRALQLLDNQGRELLHIRYGADSSIEETRNGLGPAGDQSFSRQLSALGRGEIHILPFESKDAAGGMIRLSTPVFDRTGARAGTLSLDYPGYPLLENNDARQDMSRFWLIDTAARWILGPRPGMTGFAALDHIAAGTAPEQEQEAARKLETAGSEQGQFMVGSGLYSYVKIASVMGTELKAPAIIPGSWMLLARLSPGLVAPHVERLRRNMLLIFGLTAFILLGVVATVAYHVTRRLQAEREVRGSETLFRGLLESAPDAFIITGADGRIVLVNAEAKNLFGYTQAEMEGFPLEMLIPEQFREKYLSRFNLFTGKVLPDLPSAGFDLYGLHKNGTEFPVSVSLNLVPTEGGLLVFADVRDITDKRQDERAIRNLNLRLQQRNSELENLNRELEAFSYSVSHDLCAPLRAIDGFSGFLLNDYADRLDDRGRDRLGRIRASAQHMRVLIDDMLKLSMVTRAELKFIPVDLTAVAHEVGEDLHRQYPQRDVQFNVHPAVMVQGDSRLLRIALFNLLENAWKFTARTQQASIEFGSIVQDNVATCFVRDNGAGFDMAQTERLFGAFQRLHRQDEFPGTGIGLATVQRIIRRHGGNIWAESEVGHGTKFYFTLDRQGVS